MTAQSKTASVIDCAHYVESVEEDELGYYAPVCACGWKCYPCPDMETMTDALMQHAYEAGYAQVLHKEAS